MVIDNAAHNGTQERRTPTTAPLLRLPLVKRREKIIGSVTVSAITMLTLFPTWF
jgi:hypothetical protein